MIKAVIYDMDDLMINSVSLHTKSFEEVLKEYSRDMDEIPEDLSKL